MRIRFLAAVFIVSVIGMAAILKDQQPGDILFGKWLTEAGKAKVEIFRVGKKYYGKIIWLKNPREPDASIKLDKYNPDPVKRKNTIVGATILRDFSYNEAEKEYQDGNIYDPESGKDYSCYMRFEDKDKLYVRGYIGFSMIGRTQYWTRTN